MSRALETAGGPERLAACLGVRAEQLDAWLDGQGTPPVEVFLAALDIVARGTSPLL